MRERFVAPKDDRLDRTIADNTRLSRKRASALISRGGVRVDGQRAGHPAHKVAKGAVIELRSAPRAQAAPPLVERFRDATLLVVDKPSGLPTQSTRQGGANLYELLLAREPYVGLHHRLDTPASGLVLLTLSREVNKVIAQGFAQGTIHRRYLAVVVGDPGPEGEWNTPVDDRPALTLWRRRSQGQGLSVIEASLKTGRTHQVRVHAVASDHPVVGDRRHGGAAGRVWPRLALHACALELSHPLTGNPLVVEAPVPDDLRALFERAGFFSDPPDTPTR